MRKYFLILGLITFLISCNSKKAELTKEEAKAEEVGQDAAARPEPSLARGLSVVCRDTSGCYQSFHG